MTRPLELTHSGRTAETEAIRAVLVAYGWTVIEHQVSAAEVARMTAGRGRVRLPFGEKVIHDLPGLLDYMVETGVASTMPYV